MNSNKTSLKSQLIRLGLVVPLALASVGAYATAPTPEQTTEAAANAALPVDFTKDDAATDFSDAFEPGDEATTTELVQAIATNSVLATYFGAGHDAGQNLINFNPAGIVDGVVSVQAGAGFSTAIISDTNLADLTVSASAITLGTGSESSTNGSDLLVLGGFVGYGTIGFASKFHDKVDKDGETIEADTAEKTAKEAFHPSVVAQSSGFGGGLFATYKADAESPLGLFASANIRYTKLTHLLTTKAIERVSIGAGSTDLDTDDQKENRLVKHYYGYKNGAVAGDLAVGYTLKAAEVSGFPILVKATAGIGVDYDKFEPGTKATEEAAAAPKTKPVVLVSQKFGLNLATVLLDGKLSPSVGVSLSKKGALESQAKEFGGIPAPTAKDAKFSKSLNAGIGYHFNDVITVSLGGNVLVKEKAKAGEENKPGLLGAAGVNFGLNYRF